MNQTPSPTAHDLLDWDDAFQNAAYIPGAEDFPPRWDKAAAAFRASVATRDGRSVVDLPYGPGSRQVLDLFEPPTAPRGTLVFVHGGYWHKFDKSTWSHMAGGALALGFAAALPSYTLAPEARLSDIAAEIAWALATIAARVPGPLHLAGHSAGGHLVTRLIAGDAPLDAATSARIASVLSISGLHDLRPLMATQMNEVLRLDAQEARRESPALQAKRLDVPVTAWVGAGERPEFLRQTRLLAEAWGARDVYQPGKHHFDVIEDLASPESPLIRAALSL